MYDNIEFLAYSRLSDDKINFCNVASYWGGQQNIPWFSQPEMENVAEIADTVDNDFWALHSFFEHLCFFSQIFAFCLFCTLKKLQTFYLLTFLFCCFHFEAPYLFVSHLF